MYVLEAPPKSLCDKEMYKCKLWGAFLVTCTPHRWSPSPLCWTEEQVHWLSRLGKIDEVRLSLRTGCESHGSIESRACTAPLAAALGPGKKPRQSNKLSSDKCANRLLREFC